MTQHIDLVGKTNIMAILNATPNSFSGDGIDMSGDFSEKLLLKANEAIDDGANILDLGAVATFPGAPAVSTAEELDRLSPVLKTLCDNVNVPVSVDSARAEVARAAVDSGASIINSEWGIRNYDGSWNVELLNVLKDSDAYFIVTHNRDEKPASGPFGPHIAEADYKDVVQEVFDDLIIQHEFLTQNGVAENRLIIDPGLGKGKTPKQNLELILNLSKFTESGIPVLLAASRKSFIGYVCGGEPKDRDGGTIAISGLAASLKVAILRVHDIASNAQAARFIDSVYRKCKPIHDGYTPI